MKNLLFLLTDQLRIDSLGCYGNAHSRTPNLDRLAAGGMRFERNYFANPICMPNRMSIFTGLQPRNHGLRANGGSPEMVERAGSRSGAADTGWSGLTEQLHSTAFVGQRTSQFFRNLQPDDPPFFAVASFPDPHHPFLPPESAAQPHADTEFQQPVGGPADLDSRPSHSRKHFEGTWHRTGDREKPQHVGGFSAEATAERIRNTISPFSSSPIA